MHKTYILFVLFFITNILAQNNITYITKNYNKYQDYLTKLSNDFDNIDKAAAKYKEIFTNTDIKERDYAVHLFFDKYMEIVNKFNDQIFSKAYHLDALYHHIYPDAYNNNPNQELRPIDLDFYKKLQKFSLTLNRSEGFTYVNLADNIYFSDNFKSLISENLFNYYDFLIYCQVNPVAEDGGLIVYATDVADRVVTWEKLYKSDLPDFAKQTANDYFAWDFGTLIEGLDNTPAFGFSNTKLTDEFLNAYKHVVEKYPSTITAKVFKDYLAVLKKNKFKKTKEVEKYIDDLINKSRFLLD